MLVYYLFFFIHILLYAIITIVPTTMRSERAYDSITSTEIAISSSKIVVWRLRCVHVSLCFLCNRVRAQSLAQSQFDEMKKKERSTHTHVNQYCVY